MTEVDIWIKVLESLNFSMVEEHCFQTKTNLLIYSRESTKTKLYFNRETENVTGFWIDFSGLLTMNKEKFQEDNKELFRDIILSSIIID